MFKTEIDLRRLRDHQRRIKAAMLPVNTDLDQYDFSFKNGMVREQLNHFHERASFIVTTNKSPEEWVDMLDDEVIATALLDWQLNRCQIVSLRGPSYRLKNQQTIFE